MAHQVIYESNTGKVIEKEFAKGEPIPEVIREKITYDEMNEEAEFYYRKN